MSYQPNIPIGTTKLSESYLDIQGNFQQLNTVYNVDHVPLTDTGLQKGYHKTIHSVPFSLTPPNVFPMGLVVPPAAANTGQIFTAQINDNFSTDVALFFLNAAGNYTQLTRNFSPNNGVNGYIPLPGGTVMQWGLATGIPAPGELPLLFATNNKAFPGACFAVFITGLRSNTGGDGIFIKDGSVSSTGFTFKNGSSNITSAYWMALGT